MVLCFQIFTFNVTFGPALKVPERARPNEQAKPDATFCGEQADRGPPPHLPMCSLNSSSPPIKASPFKSMPCAHL